MTQHTVVITVEVLAANAYLGVVVTVAGLIVWLDLLNPRCGKRPVYLQPVFGISASVYLFGNKLGLMFATGVGLVLAGLGLAAAGK